MGGHRVAVAGLLAVTVACGLSATACAGKHNKKLDIGDKAPEFKQLIGVDDKKHGTAEFKDADVMVVCFTCNHCPVAVDYEDRFKEFTKQYKEKGVAFVAVNVNNLAADKLPKMKERAKKKEFNFPYLYDPTQKIARDFGATCTPHLFVLCAKRKIAYMGAFDDSRKPDKVTKQYVRDAVDALLAGKAPEVTETLQVGCGIKYEDK